MSFLSALPTRLVTRLGALSFRRRWLLALAAGGFCSLGLPPLSAFPVPWLSLPLLILLLRGTARPGQAFALGWAFAFGYFLIGLYWIAAALFVDIQQFFWLLPFTVAGLPAVLALYYGLAAWLWRRLELTGVTGALALALLFSLAEYGRGHLFSGFPWNLFGYVWAEILPVAQSVSLFGSYGLTLLTLIAACLPAALLDRSQSARIANGLAVAIFAGLAFWGALRLQQNPTDFTPDGFVRLVQPNIPQQMKWDAKARERNFQTLLTLSAQPSTQSVTHVIWPETALTGYLTEDAARRAVLANALPPGSILLTGTVRRHPDFAQERWDYFNSLVAMDSGGAAIAAYDKFHLVPFGEYVPFSGFGPVASATAGMGAFTSGPGPQTLQVPGLPRFSPLICYEVIFPGAVTDPALPPQLLLNITNDGWYGRTAGPYQHMAIARMRAVEEGMPLLRVANTGISAAVDAAGRIVQSLPLGAQGVIDLKVPRALTTPTLYARHGDLGFWLVFSALWACIASVTVTPTHFIKFFAWPRRKR